MFTRLFFSVLFICQIILNESAVVPENKNSTTSKPSTTTRKTFFPQGYTIFPEDHAAYKIHEERATWYEARDQCKSEGGRLAIPDTVNETQHIISLKTDWEFKWIHVGIYRSNSDDTWLRVDSGMNATNVPWAEGNPDDMGHCAGISLYEDGIIDYPCDYSTKYYVCEILL